jgi:hypothetical protein
MRFRLGTSVNFVRTALNDIRVLEVMQLVSCHRSSCRSIRPLFLILVVSGIAGFTQPSLAQRRPPVADKSLLALVPLKNGSKTCWTRQYDRTHLDLHKHQKTKKIDLCVMVQQYPKISPTTYVHNFNLEIQLRDGSSPLRASGECNGVPGDSATRTACLVECDGGGFDVKSQNDGRLKLTLDAIRMSYGCDTENNPRVMRGGLDDREFILRLRR